MSPEADVGQSQASATAGLSANRIGHTRSMRTPLAKVILPLLALADDPADDEGTTLRKRVGVVAGYVTILAPLTLPIQANGVPISWVMAIGLSA